MVTLYAIFGSHHLKKEFKTIALSDLILKLQKTTEVQSVKILKLILDKKYIKPIFFANISKSYKKIAKDAKKVSIRIYNIQNVEG